MRQTGTRLRIVALIAAMAAVLAIMLRLPFAGREPEGAQFGHAAIQIDENIALADRRLPDQSMLTFPEWYLVYSPREYADFLEAKRPPSQFPFIGHQKQMWNGYAAVSQEASRNHPFNTDYHVMNSIICTSTSVEYSSRWLYETSIGRLTENTTFGARTAEDELATQVAREYAAFLDLEPWYNFDYASALRRTWTETGYWGPAPFRKWERKYALTTEYILKAIYAKLIGSGSESSYGVIATTTVVRVAGWSDAVQSLVSDAKLMEGLSDGTSIIEFPRYQPFTHCVEQIADTDARFISIAGNTGDIMLTAIAKETESANPSVGRVLFTQPILIRPGEQRRAIVVPISDLIRIVSELKETGAEIEHIYDF